MTLNVCPKVKRAGALLAIKLDKHSCNGLKCAPFATTHFLQQPSISIR
jgi:hypothetical protein